jgi:hypothetical protein
VELLTVGNRFRNYLHYLTGTALYKRIKTVNFFGPRKYNETWEMFM